MTRELALGLGLAVGGAAYLAMLGYVWRRRRAAGGSSLVLALLGIFVWSSCYAIELTTDSVATAAPWANLKFVGIVTVPAALWVFVRQYTTRRGLSRRAIALLCVEPAVVLGLLAVPATRSLVHAYSADDMAAAQLPGPPVPVPGPLFWPHALYSWLLLLAALGLFVQRVGRVGGPYRRQANVVIVASLLPLVGNVAYNLDLFGLGRVDPAPFLFLLFTTVLVWGIFRLRLLDLVPVARGRAGGADGRRGGRARRPGTGRRRQSRRERAPGRTPRRADRPVRRRDPAGRRPHAGRPRAGEHDHGRDRAARRRRRPAVLRPVGALADRPRRRGDRPAARAPRRDAARRGGAAPARAARRDDAAGRDAAGRPAATVPGAGAGGADRGPLGARGRVGRDG